MAVVVAIASLAPWPAAAQEPAERIRIGGFVGLTHGDGGAGRHGGLAVTYRVAPRLMVEVDAAYVAGLYFGRFPFCAPGAELCPSEGDFTLRRRGVLLTGNLLWELPDAGRWVKPYLLAGGGYAAFRRVRGRWLPVPTETTQAPALAIGGGLLFPVSRHLGVRADARYQLVSHETPGFGARRDVSSRFGWVRMACSIEAAY